MMTCIAVADDPAGVCANCGKNGNSEVGAVKLKNCTACLLVQYCGVECQKAHRKLHKKACKQRAAELKDEQLYSQGLERPEGDFCSICTLPIPLPIDGHSFFNVCCMTRVCNGCRISFSQATCAFCRTPRPKNDSASLAMVQKRVDARDAEAMAYLGNTYHKGQLGLEKNVQRAIEMWTKAAELGSNKACYELGRLYILGDDVGQDEAKGIGYWKRAATKGDVLSRYSLGVSEGNRGNHQQGLKHILISAKMGHKESLDTIQEMFTDGFAKNEYYAEALEGYQEAVEETKSHQRDEANAELRAFRGRK